jgi:hypothetical protein
MTTCGDGRCERVEALICPQDCVDSNPPPPGP